MDLNRATIIGRLTKDPESKTTARGTSMVVFSVATSSKWVSPEGEPKESTEFHDCTAWGKLADIIAQYGHKGQKVYVEGKLDTRSWEAEDGTKRYRTGIVVSEYNMVESKRGGLSRDEQTNIANDFKNEDKEEIRAEEIPF